ncbi:hypothetical protein BJX66DRAFT_336259 [Aspergillus keveii]|uniref:AA1-like domain-containing protein n=1 Tax=Aspergillus keveii TaxID=714993 RepID=A0ABR4GCE4_9EURO
MTQIHHPLSLIALAISSSWARAEGTNTTTSMYLWGINAETIHASIMGNDQTAITYSFTCPPLPDYSVCAFGEGVTAVDAGDRITWWGGKGGYGEDGDATIACTQTTHWTAVCTITSETEKAHLTVGNRP